jgi:arylsulfatase A-like enzyme/Tfp pilus assembly protein PilF
MTLEEPTGRPQRRAAALAAVLCVVGFVASCSRAAPPRGIDAPSNLSVILITIDTLRADHVGVYGDRADTPNLDRLAREGVVFGRCIAQTPLTLPSHTTILSGTYPLHHRVRGNGGTVVPPDLELVSEVLRTSGFATSAFVSAYVLDSKWGLDQGFDLYEDDLDAPGSRTPNLHVSRRAGEVIASAEEWLGEHKDRRFFSWIHLFDPHSLYDPPPPFDRYPEDPYRGEVEYTDHAVGQLLGFLEKEGISESTLIIVTSDHGESLGDHGELEHGLFVYESTVWVPLIIRPPFEPSNRKWDDLVELVDVAPTILDSVGVAIPEGYQGTSLWDVVLGSTTPEPATAYTETFYPRLHHGWSELKATYRHQLKYISAPRDELYDLGADFGERFNLAGDPAHANEMRTMEELLEETVEQRSAAAVATVSQTLSREDMAALRALGYTTTTVETSGPAALADPKDRISVFNRLGECAGLQAQGRFDESIAIAREIVRAEPHLVDAHLLLGDALANTGRLRQAVESFETVLELKPDENLSMNMVLELFRRIGAYDETVAAGLRFLETFPEDPLLLEQVGYAYASLGEPYRALEYLSTSIAIEPNATRLTKAGELYGLEGDYAAAEASLQRALDIDPSIPGTRFLLAQVAESRGDGIRALELYGEELEIDPGSFRSAFRVAVILRSQGRIEEAIPYCRRAIEANPRFSLPYFMIAEHFLQTGTNLEEAIELCRRGLDVAPDDQVALAGSQILVALLERTGDRAGSELASRRVEALQRKLEAER